MSHELRIHNARCQRGHTVKPSFLLKINKSCKEALKKNSLSVLIIILLDNFLSRLLLVIQSSLIPPCPKSAMAVCEYTHTPHRHTFILEKTEQMVQGMHWMWAVPPLLWDHYLPNYRPVSIINSSYPMTNVCSLYILDLCLFWEENQDSQCSQCTQLKGEAQSVSLLQKDKL